MNILNYRFTNRFEETNSLLNKLDALFPIPLSEKVDLTVYTQKLLEKGKVICCYNGVEPVGIICFYCNDKKTKVGYISIIGVLPDFQGRNIAKTLINLCFKECKNNNMKKVFLYTHKTNTNAIKMNESIGFVRDISDRKSDVKFLYNF